MVAHVASSPSLAPEELARIAKLHRSELPSSILGMMGPATLARYYGWSAISAQEHLFLAGRKESIAGAAVVSLAPSTLISRFIRHSPLRFCVEGALAFAGGGTFRKQALAFVREREPDPPADEEPELMQIFIAASQRGHAVGSRLLKEIEQVLVGLGCRSYVARTLAANNDATLAFYRKREFTLFARRSFCGHEYVFLRKSLAA